MLVDLVQPSDTNKELMALRVAHAERVESHDIDLSACTLHTFLESASQLLRPRNKNSLVDCEAISMHLP